MMALVIATGAGLFGLFNPGVKLEGMTYDAWFVVTAVITQVLLNRYPGRMNVYKTKSLNRQNRGTRLYTVPQGRATSSYHIVTRPPGARWGSSAT
jgi:hypothetical protein